MVRVLIVEDVTLVSDAIRLALHREPDIHVVGVATCASEALVRLADSDIVLVNIRLRNDAALDLVERLRRRDRVVKVVVMNVQSPERELLPFLDPGIAGYVLASSDLEGFVEALRMVHRGEAAVSPKVAATLMNRLAQLARAHNLHGWNACMLPVDALTAREYEVIELIARGLSNQEIADCLTIEVGTVKNHVHNILGKLNVSSRRAAAALVARSRSTVRNERPALNSVALDPAEVVESSSAHDRQRRVPA